jgi:uncharacterized protein HemX
MERKEPTLSTSTSNTAAHESAPVPRRSAAPAADEAPVRQARPAAAPKGQVAPAAVSSSLPAIALVIALVAAAGAGFLGWQLLQAQATLVSAEARILGLEQQLSLTSEESSASVVGLQATVKKLDGDLRKFALTTEDQRKAIAASLEKINGLVRDTAQIRKDAVDAKSGLAAIKPELSATKTQIDAVVKKIDNYSDTLGQQGISVQQLREDVSRFKLELADVDALARRTKVNEDAIAAIDDFRRSTNRELLQIRQQLAPAK